MPKPKVQILVCLNERSSDDKKGSCAPRGALKLYHRFKDEIKERGLKKDVMVVRTGCLKHCSQGCAVAVWPHNFWYRKVTVKDVDEILETTVKKGEEVERLRMPDIPWE
jgi:(2Fe-2S) ferredoxin